MKRRYGFSLMSVFALSVALWLIAAAPGRAQFATVRSGSITGVSTPIYNGYYPPLASYSPSSVNSPSSYGYRTVPLDPNTVGYPPIFMTSINYPGVYGMYTYGVSSSVFNVAPALASTSHYPPASAEKNVKTLTPLRIPGGEAALIDVKVPASAELWFDGVKTSKAGTLRDFITPALAPGKDFIYEVKAIWSENGREYASNRRVFVRAGDHVEVDFTRSPAGEISTATMRARTTLP